MIETISMPPASAMTTSQLTAPGTTAFTRPLNMFLALIFMVSPLRIKLAFAPERVLVKSAARRRDLCQDIFGCTEAPQSLHVEGPNEIDEAILALVVTPYL
jgi:hypothetical protein